jgi:GT2 family glycosyltransferase
MNWMLADATKKNVDFIFHFHSDAVSSNPSAVTELLEYARKVMGEGRKWACLWTFYDILWVINPVAARDVGGWDTVFPSYFVDQDIRRRWNLAGWETIDTHIEGLSHEGSATINSDENLKFINGVTFPLYRAYYCRKWGGEPGHETYQTQFNR